MQFRTLFYRPALRRHRFSTKTVLVMKLTSFFLLAACLQVSARGLSQTVSFSGHNVTLESVFDEVKKQTGYVFFYDADLLKEARPVTIKAENVALEKFLSDLLADQPLKFSIKNKNIIISRKPVPREAASEPAASLDTIRGYVRDSTGAPLQGASVTIKGTKDGATTD